MTQPHDASDTAAGSRTTSLRGIRRIAIVAIIVSLSLTAIVGIVALLSNEYGAVQGNILTTAVLVAAFSTLALCHLAVLGRPVRVVGFVGLALGTVSLVLGLVQIWTGWNFSDEVFRWFGITGIAATSLAHANLLLLLSGRRHSLVRISLAVTLAAIAGVALLLILPIATRGEFPGEHYDAYSRWLGVIAIIDALGTIVTPIVAPFVRGRDAGTHSAPAPSSAEASDPLDRSEPSTRLGPFDSLDPRDPLEQRIATIAAESGLDRATLLTAALDAFEASRRRSTGG
jgi:hypothetical protein